MKKRRWASWQGSWSFVPAVSPSLTTEAATLVLGTKMRNRGFETTFLDTCQEKGWVLVKLVQFTATSEGAVVLWKSEEWQPLDWVTNDKYQIAVLQRKP